MTTSDPEKERVLRLVGRVESGHATEAEREELQLYRDEDESFQLQITEEEKRLRLGGQWLERVEKDKALQSQENDPAVRMERGIGVGLLLAGFFFGGPLLTASGAAILTWSFVRMRLRTYKDDPYGDIEQ